MSTSEATQAGPSPKAWVAANPLWKVGVAALLAAGVAAELFGVLARLINVPMETPAFGGDEAEGIMPGGFIISTLIWGGIGIGIALLLAKWASRPALLFFVIAVAGTVLSFGLPIMAEDTDTATKVVLALSHVVAAAVIIPPVTLRLAQLEVERGTDTETDEPTNTETGTGTDPAEMDEATDSDTEDEPAGTETADTGKTETADEEAGDTKEPADTDTTDSAATDTDEAEDTKA